MTLSRIARARLGSMMLSRIARARSGFMMLSRIAWTRFVNTVYCSLSFGRLPG
jgi:hypothetical protein